MAYSRADKEYLDKLRIQFAPYIRKGTIKLWYDGEIIPGEVWEDKIKQSIHKADIIILLVSPDSLNSDFFYEKELADAMKRHRLGKVKVIPVIIQPCQWQATDLAELQALPKDGNPIVKWPMPSEAYDNIVEGAMKQVFEILRGEEEARVTLEAEIKKREKGEASIRAEEEAPIIKSTVLKNKATRNPISYELKHPKSNFPKWIPIGVGLLLLLLIGWIYFGREIAVPKMIFVEGGTFKMGCNDENGNDCFECEKPEHKVNIASYSIMQTEVTQRLWKQVMGTNPSYNQNCDECPVENVTWDMVQNFIEKLNQKTGKKYRLPSEAEWEFAARGGNKSQGYKYAGSNILEEVGWFDQSGDGKTHPVSQKKHNELELYDMSGNVWEWCNDWYDSTYYYNTPIDNPIGPSKLPNTCRVYRGGCWSSKSHSCKVSSRLIYTNRINYKLIGFRLALSAEHGR